MKARCDKGLYNKLAAPVGSEDAFLDNTCGAPDFNRLFQCQLHTNQTILAQKSKQNRIPMAKPQLKSFRLNNIS